MNKLEREELTKTIEQEDGNFLWKKDTFIEKIQPYLPKSLEIVSLPPEYENNYNCFVYAFGLENDPEFLGGKNPIQKEFIRYLMLWNFLEKDSSLQKGNVIFYIDKDDTITHSGILVDDQHVISKWMWGPIIKNKIMDVPSSFGDTYVTYKPVSPEFVKKKYFEYKESGVEIQPIL